MILYILTLGINVFSDCCLFSFSIFISDRILSLDALNFLCCVSICCIWFISWSISLLIRGCNIKEACLSLWKCYSEVSCQTMFYVCSLITNLSERKTKPFSFLHSLSSNWTRINKDLEAIQIQYPFRPFCRSCFHEQIRSKCSLQAL